MNKSINIKFRAALIILSMLFWFRGNAQVLDKKITLQFNNITLEEALSVIASNYQIKIYYSSSVLHVKTKVNQSFNEVELSDVLQKICNNPNLSFTSDGDRVIISLVKTPKYVFSGFVLDNKTKETLPGVIIYNQEKTYSVQTNANGYFALTLNKGINKINFLYIGFEPQQIELNIEDNLTKNVLLEPNANLNEIVIESEKDETKFLPNKIEVSTIHLKQVPMILGETDVIKYLMLMPGIQKGNEGNNGMFVRGGKPDQNLILIDDAIIYNGYHLFGLNSMFTGAELKKVDLYKGGFPANYGGRLSSVLDLTIKDGNKQKMAGEASLGLISSKAMVEGPMFNKNASFMFSARRTYLELMTRPFIGSNEGLGYYYYDVHGKISVHVNPNHKIAISTYIGSDVFGSSSKEENYSSENSLTWGNKMASIKHTAIISKRLTLTSNASYSNYHLKLLMKDENDQYYSVNKITSSITDYSLKTNLDFIINNNHQVKLGASVINHSFSPTIFNSDNFMLNQSSASNVSVKAIENAYYIDDNLTLFNKLIINTGLRISTFSALNSNYFFVEPRISLTYKTNKDITLVGSYGYMTQYQHLLSTFGMGLPTDIWLPVAGSLKPATSNQYTFGASRNFARNKIKFGMDGYYKLINNQAIYKEGKSILNVIPASFTNSFSLWEDMVTQGNCTSYGVEFFLKFGFKNYSLITAYTLSKTTKQFSEVNLGRAFLAYYDRRHDLSITQQVKVVKNLLFVSSWVYGSGYRFTLPSAEYYAYSHAPVLGNNYVNSIDFIQASFYSGRNNYQAAPFHRLDISLQYLKPGKLGLSTFELSVYNVYNRQNAFFHSIEPAGEFDDRRVLKQISLFPIIPSFSYNFKF